VITFGWNGRSQSPECAAVCASAIPGSALAFSNPEAAGSRRGSTAWTDISTIRASTIPASRRVRANCSSAIAGSRSSRSREPLGLGQLYRPTQDHVGNRLSALRRLLPRGTHRSFISRGEASGIGRGCYGVLRSELTAGLAGSGKEVIERVLSIFLSRGPASTHRDTYATHQTTHLDWQGVAISRMTSRKPALYKSVAPQQQRGVRPTYPGALVPITGCWQLARGRALSSHAPSLLTIR
jgi:hypothetical protein